VSTILLVGGSAVILMAVICLVASRAIEYEPATLMQMQQSRPMPRHLPATTPIQVRALMQMHQSGAPPDWVRRMLTCPLDQLGRVIVADIAAVYALGGAA
jgi:hypothetical protein